MGVPAKKVARKPGIHINKPKPKFEYRPVGNKPKEGVNKLSPSTSVLSNNPFDVLNNEDADNGQCSKGVGGEQEDSDDEEVVEVYNETDKFIMEGTHNPNKKRESHVDVMKLSKVCSAVFRHWDWTSNGNCFVYADNYYVTRRELWAQLSLHKLMVADKPWVIMGDFNSALYLEDKSMGTSAISVGMRDFQTCISDIEVMDVNRSGLHFTWTQKPKKGVGLLKKIDWVMANDPFVAEFPNSVDVFRPYRLSDHAPCILKFQRATSKKHKPFKFPNLLVYKPDFMNIVKQIWETRVNGVYQFKVVKKLRHLKSPLRALLFRHGNLHKKVVELRGKLEDIQKDIDQDPMNTYLRARETNLTSFFQEACLDEERFLKQKAKMDWLRAGDANTAYFHAAVKSRNHRSRIQVISDANGVMYEADNVHAIFVQHYEKFLGCQDDIYMQPTPDLFSKQIDLVDASHMIRQGRMYLKQSWIFSLRCITKIIADRIKGVLHQVVSINQSAFIPGRKISDNILLTQELMHNYYRNSGPPRCAFKVDIQKAYDTVDWSFLKKFLIGFGFHAKMVEWIMVCISTVSYSICINGNVHGYFMGKRGSRQGDPLSPYLFTLVMEVLTCILQHASRIDASFKFHNKCEKQRIINLCFADDLFLFARGDVNSAKFIMSSLTKFTNMSGLVPSIQKSTGFFCNVPTHVKDHILDIMSFKEGLLPVRYSLQVWNMVRSKGGMKDVGPFWDDIIGWVAAQVHSKSAATYVSKLVLAAASYFIWQERNSRLFKNQTRPPDVLSDVILQTVWYKLMVVKFKNNVKVRELLSTWGIHGTLETDE
ncbi:uncharacterized protein LOC110931970 [Helianthus annuus]|uniref:uncharacterized protein LOC110931970 n=1 Tax=Helianthus annuus TaxID=4232 RepID=UPI000B8F9BCB|nr:uncharacterized protein LOC110931970 [Helianthus annuus]